MEASMEMGSEPTGFSMGEKTDSEKASLWATQA
jgi:hypothetical protein